MRGLRTTVIAEIGENHAGDWDRARRMVAEAARAGADIVKFQSYRGGDVAKTDPEKKWFTRTELPDSLHAELMDLARKNGVGFLSAPFTVERARFLCERLGLRAVKIASSEMTNEPLLHYVAGKAQTVYLSTGMATLDEIAQALRLLSGVPEVSVLHCVTQYPLKDAEANLRAIATLQKTFPDRATGYSDHTIGILAPVAAVALGAKVVEKHFTMDRSLPGTDHVLSALPEEFRMMVDQIRRVEILLGEGGKAPAASELLIRDFVRSRFPKTAGAL